MSSADSWPSSQEPSWPRTCPSPRTLIDQRVGAWLNPWGHYASYGYQTVQGELALGRGGLTGSGLGLGSPYNIPVAYSDFIFAAIGEELGLLGHDGGGRRFPACCRRGDTSRDTGTLGVLPTRRRRLHGDLGVPVLFHHGRGGAPASRSPASRCPFIGYGGSSLLANYVLVALLMRISDEGGTPAGVPLGPVHRATRMRQRALAAARSAPDGRDLHTTEVTARAQPARDGSPSPELAGGTDHGFRSNGTSS